MAEASTCSETSHWGGSRRCFQRARYRFACVQVLAGCRGVFTAPTFATFVLLVTGALGGSRCPDGDRDVVRGRNVDGAALVERAPVLLPRPLGHRRPRAGAGPDRCGGLRRPGRGGDGRGGRHPVPPLRPQGVRCVLAARRVGQGPRRDRPRQLLRDRRAGRRCAVHRPEGLPTVAVPAAPAQDQRIQAGAGPPTGRPARRRVGRPARARGRGQRLQGPSLASPSTDRHVHHPSGLQRRPVRPGPTAHRPAGTPGPEGRQAGHSDRSGRHRDLETS